MKSQIARFQFVLWLLPLAWLWLVLFNDLRVEWTVNPQYSYGWAVPFLCLYLLGRNLFELKDEKRPSHIHLSRIPAIGLHSIFIVLALFYLPTRLIQEANPGWRLVSWALALEVVGLTLCWLRMTIPGAWFKVRNYSCQFSTFIFPVCFFLVAVPWPTLLEGPLIQVLTRMDVGVTCELAGWFGIPAIPHGNVIQVATGDVGIDEACSGIRSFQATLMISLFLGEFYALGGGRRVFCVATGFFLALLLNVARLAVLVWVAASRGVPAIAGWHDPTGVIILLGCFFALWGIGRWLAPPNPKSEVRNQKSETRPSEISAFRFPLSVLALAVWLVLVETGVEGWYRYHEACLPAPVEWRVDWPLRNTSFKERDIALDSRRILRFDEGRNVIWQEDDLGWQVVFLHWNPGRAAVRLAKNHTPELCLAAAGHQLEGGKSLQFLTVHGLELPVRFYQLTDTAQPVFIVYCLWDDRASSQNFETSFLTYGSRLAPVLAGIRNPGQRSIEIALTGANNLASAQVAIQNLLEKIISPIH